MCWTCNTCKSCVSISETLPFGQCLFFQTGPRNVNVFQDSCPNHTKELEDERRLEEEYYKSLRKRR